MAEQTWFTSDHHLGHRNIVTLAHRPFADVDEMDAALVRSWNERVGKDDVVYHLGDLVFKARDPEVLLASLHGRIRLVRGNHEDVADRHRGRFEWVKDIAEIKVVDPEAPDGVRRLVLCHYAMRVWNRSHHGAWHLYGHSHGSLYDDPGSLSLDVGVDARNYAPVSYGEVKELMTQKAFRPVDHHGRQTRPEIEIDRLARSVAEELMREELETDEADQPRLRAELKKRLLQRLAERGNTMAATLTCGLTRKPGPADFIPVEPLPQTSEPTFYLDPLATHR